MELKVTGKKFEITDWMKDYCDEKIGGAARVFNIEPLTIEVVLTQEKNPSISNPATCEVTLFAGGHVIHVEENEVDMRAAIDVASAKVMRQLRKYKTRVMDKKIMTQEKHAKRQMEGAIGSELDLDALMDDLSEEDIMRVKDVTIEPISKDEAIVRMDLLGHDFFLFSDAETGKCAVLYRRKNGGYGLLQQK